MKREERLTNILVLLQEQKIVLLQDIMQKFGVANRTVKRDIQLLRKRGIRIRSKQGVNGGNQLISGQDVFHLFLNRKEISLLYYALASIDIQGKTLSRSEIDLLMEKLKDLVIEEGFLF